MLVLGNVLVQGICVEGSEKLQPDLACGAPLYESPAARSLCRGIQAVLTASCAELSQVSFVRTTIEAVGLNGNKMSSKDVERTFGKELARRSVWNRNKLEGLWQDPLQLASALVHISQHSDMLAETDVRGGVSRYVEVGVYTAWTTCLIGAYARRATGRASHFEGFAVDVTFSHISNETRAILSRLNISLQTPASMKTHLTRWGGTPSGPAPLNLCLIDGDHTFNGVRRDYIQYAPHCHSVVLHDIMDDLVFYHDKGTGGGVPGFWSLLVKNVGRQRTFPFYMHLGSLMNFGLGIVGAGGKDRVLYLSSEDSESHCPHGDKHCSGATGFLPGWLTAPHMSKANVTALLCEQENPMARCSIKK